MKEEKMKARFRCGNAVCEGRNEHILTECCEESDGERMSFLKRDLRGLRRIKRSVIKNGRMKSNTAAMKRGKRNEEMENDKFIVILLSFFWRVKIKEISAE